MSRTFYRNTWGPPHPDDVDLVVGGIPLGRVRKVVERIPRQPTIDALRDGYNPFTKIWTPDSENPDGSDS